MTSTNWYWIHGTTYCPACVECDTPAVAAADCTRGPSEGLRCACCHETESVEVTRYRQDGGVYICAGDAYTRKATARAAAESALRNGERLADDMERVDGCCTWTVITGDA